MSIKVRYLHPQATADHVGFIPSFLDEADPRPAAEQFHERYSHGGGWHPIEGFELERLWLHYPGDPPLRPLAYITFRTEVILIYEAAFVCILQPDQSFAVARMD